MRITGPRRGLGIVLTGAIAAAVIATTLAACSSAATSARTSAGTDVGTIARTSARTWSVEPGGIVTGRAQNIVLKDVTTGLSVSCASAATTIALKSGHGLANPIGRITSVTFSKCVVPGGIPLTATASATQKNPWHLSGISYANGVNVGMMTNLAATISGPGCSATMGGSTVSSTGSTVGHYYNSKGLLQIISSNLHIWKVKGCFGFLRNGDTAAMLTHFTFSPRQSISIP